jgi:hypothetical protein
MKRTLVLCLSMIVLFSSCHYFDGERVKGDGNITTQTHSVTDFEGVEVGGAIELYVTTDPSYSVKVEADKNLHEFIEVFKTGNTLHVRPANNTNLSPSGKIKVYVSAPSYTKIGASGACNVESQNKLISKANMLVDLSGASEAKLDIQSPNVDVEASGACGITLKGETKNLSISCSGSTSVKAFDLLSENADVEISGAGDVDVYVSVKLNASTSGASSIRYKGNATVSTDVSGSGSVKKVD